MAKGLLSIILICGWTIFGVLLLESNFVEANEDFPIVADDIHQSLHKEMKYLEIREVIAGKNSFILKRS